MIPKAQEPCSRCGRRQATPGSEFCAICQDEVELERMRSRFKSSEPAEAAPPPGKPAPEKSGGPGLLQRGLNRLGLGRGAPRPEREPESPPQVFTQNFCAVDVGDGQLCGQLARRYDKERGILVCDDHTVWWCPACRQSHTRSQVKQVERS